MPGDSRADCDSSWLVRQAVTSGFGGVATRTEKLQVAVAYNNRCYACVQQGEFRSRLGAEQRSSASPAEGIDDLAACRMDGGQIGRAHV